MGLILGSNRFQHPRRRLACAVASKRLLECRLAQVLSSIYAPTEARTGERPDSSIEVVIERLEDQLGIERSESAARW